MQTVESLTIEYLASQMPDDERWELVNGELVPMSPASRPHTYLAFRLVMAFGRFIEPRGSQWQVTGDGAGFIVSREPDSIYSPDVSIYRQREMEPGPWFPFAPEVAVEIRSPDQTMEYLREKAASYLKAGSEQVWIVDGKSETIRIHRPDGTRLIYQDELLRGFGALDGFEMHVGEFFAGSPYREKQD